MSPPGRGALGQLLEQMPRGPVFTPEAYGAVGDLVLFTDGAMTVGSNQLSSASFSGAVAGSKRIYVAYAGAGVSLGTLSAGTGVAPINTLARTAGAAYPNGPVVVSSASHAQLFNINTAGGVNTSLPVTTATPYFNFPIGSALSYANPGLTTTISSIAGTVASLGASAGQTVQNMVGWYGTDDTAAFLLMLLDVLAVGGGTILLANKGYLLDGNPLTTRGGNAILPLPLVSRGAISILGTSGSSPVASEFSYANSEISGTTLATTRQSDIYSATYGAPSMIGGPTFESTGNQYPGIGMLRMEDVTFLKPENPSIGTMDCSLFARAEKRRCYSKTAGQINRAAYNMQANISTGYGAMGQVPSHPWNFGFWMPDPFNFGQSIASDCAAVGDYCAFPMSAHTELDNCFAIFCTMALGFNDLGGRATGVHLNKLNRFGIFACNYQMGGWDPVNGAHSLVASAGIVTLEGELAVEPDTNQWAQNPSPILDVNGRIRGRLVSHNYSAFGDVKQVISSPSIIIKDADPAGLIPQSYDDLVIADFPLSYYMLNDPSGTTAKDGSGRFNGTPIGSPLSGLQGPMGDSCFKFDGATQGVTLDTLPGIGSSPNTACIEFFVAWTGTATGNVYLMGVIGGAAASTMFIRPNWVGAGTVAGSTTFAIGDNNNVNKRAGHITTPIYDGLWHHVVWNPSTAGTHVVYVDGVPQPMTMDTTGTLGATSNFDVTWDLAGVDIGGGINHFGKTICRLQRVAFYTAQMSQLRIQQHFQAVLRTR